MSDYIVTVAEYVKKNLIGLKVRTSMQKAHLDCPALWQSFGPRLDKILPDGCQGSYGLCIMLNPEEFDYWAAVEFDPSSRIPADLEKIELPAGFYAKTTVLNLEKLGPAYTYLYDEWLKSQPGYVTCLEAPCFELYPPDWQVNDAFEIFMPVSKV